ncbi:MAG: hypothetical protein ABSA86_01745 [Oryzomonas sp.]|jgi:hypothetical protein
MTSGAVGSKQLQDIEIAVIGNAFCLLIASAGLLAGSMAANLSLEYWREDIVALAITAFMGIRLLRNLMAAMTLYQETPLVHHHQRAETQERVNVQPEGVVTGQIPAVSSFSPDQVVEEVVKRIEMQKAEAAKKNKNTN